MLSEQDNALVTQTGPDTPMGRAFRRHWIPAFLSAELADPGGPPVRIKLLGERLVGFRDTEGQVGLMPEHCPHRRASLFLGRVEAGGLRCAYHGWKFDVTGQCVDMPNEPPESAFKEKVRQTAYECREVGGVVWTFMGDEAHKPSRPPELEWTLVPPSHHYISKRIQDSNYLQALEGGIDSSHISFLHRGDLRTSLNSQAVVDTAPKFETLTTEFGLTIGARRNADDERYYWRVTQWLLPWYSIIPRFEDLPFGGHAWVPIDDEHCWTWSFAWHPDRPISREEIADWQTWTFVHAELVPGTFRPVLNAENDYMIDRELQRSGKSFTGIKGLGIQDTAVQESMGPICDRTKERLGASDAAIIQVRRRLLKAAKDAIAGQEGPGPDPRSYRVRSASAVLPRTLTAWPEAIDTAVPEMTVAGASSDS